MTLSEKIKIALLQESNKCLRRQNGVGTCCIDGCGLPAVSNGLCNAHYIRMKKGKDMSIPVRNRRAGKLCKQCGSPINGKGGWNLCSKCYSVKRRKVIKDVCIEHLGGCCSVCKNKFPTSVYDFHHKEHKDFGIGYLIANTNPDTVEKELLKCILVCANCHRIIHNEGGHDYEI